LNKEDDHIKKKDFSIFWKYFLYFISTQKILQKKYENQPKVNISRETLSAAMGGDIFSSIFSGVRSTKDRTCRDIFLETISVSRVN